MVSELLKAGGVQALVEAIEAVQARVAEATDSELIDLFAKTKPLEKATKLLNEDVRLELISRRDHGSVDDKGHRYLVSGDSAVKLQRSVRLKLAQDAADTLEEAGVLDAFPRVFDNDKAAVTLSRLGVNPREFTSPRVDVDTLGAALEDGLINQDLATRCIAEESVIWSVTAEKVTKIPRLLEAV